MVAAENGNSDVSAKRVNPKMKQYSFKDLEGENEKFIQIMDKPKRFFNLQKCKHRDRKTHVYRKCPSCKNNLRLPKEKGKHTVACPCCKHRFDVKI